MSETTNEFKLSKPLLKPIQGTIIGLLAIAVVYLFYDGVQCKEKRVEEASAWANKFVDYAKEVGEIKKQEIIQELQPKIDETKEQTDSMLQKINTLRKTKRQ